MLKKYVEFYDIPRDVMGLMENYGNWLLQRVNFKKRGYSRLMKLLHETKFTYIHPMDVNRAEDGIYQRIEFLETLGGNVPDKVIEMFEDLPCSVLEMLVALAVRCEKEYIGDPTNSHPEVLFWEMCCNLGLDQYKNQGFTCEKHRQICEKLVNWMERIHKENGEGSIFPVKNSTKNHKEIEIWEQMMDYLMNFHQIL